MAKTQLVRYRFNTDADVRVNVTDNDEFIAEYVDPMNGEWCKENLGIVRKRNK